MQSAGCGAVLLGVRTDAAGRLVSAAARGVWHSGRRAVYVDACRAGVLVVVYDGAQRCDFFADGIRRDLAGVAADGGTARVRGGFGTAWRAAACALGAADGVAGRAGSAVVTGAELETIGLL